MDIQPQSNEVSVEDAMALMFSEESTPDDKRRWHSQSFVLNPEPDMPCYLQQQEGGPCGVLAVVQAEVLRKLIFGADTNGIGRLPTPIPEAIETAMLAAMATIIQRTACVERAGGSSSSQAYVSDVIILTRSPPEHGPLQPIQAYTIKGGKERGEGEIVACLRRVSGALHGPGGIMQFLLSVVLTRGPGSVRRDMDDGGGGLLTGQFGHCTQELLNLLLCGCAVSNVFDGSMSMGGMSEDGDSSLMLRGVPSRPTVGYLSHLESLRYLEVGGYYKTPLDPVWVVGSSSHFTVLFGVTRESIEETQSEKLLERVRRAFESVDNSSESGFISVQSLKQVLEQLLPELAKQEHKVSALASKLEIAGSSIIVWSDFWQAVSRLLTGASLEVVLTSDNAAGGNTSNNSSVINLTNSPISQPRPRSDSDVARELQAQFDGTAGGTSSSIRNSATTPTRGGGSMDMIVSPAFTPIRVRSDSDVARELQAQFDAQDRGTAGLQALAMVAAETSIFPVRVDFP